MQRKEPSEEKTASLEGEEKQKLQTRLEQLRAHTSLISTDCPFCGLPEKSRTLGILQDLKQRFVPQFQVGQGNTVWLLKTRL